MLSSCVKFDIPFTYHVGECLGTNINNNNNWLLICPMFCLGVDYEATFGQHSGDQTISESIKGATGINSSAGSYIYSFNFWSYYRARPSASLWQVLRGFESVLN